MMRVFSFLSKSRYLLALAALLLITSCTPPDRDELNNPPGDDQPVSPPMLSALDPDGDGQVTFQGVVVENNFGCEVDAACFLRVRIDSQAVTVVYHYGEWPPCENGEATLQGFEVSVGDKVEVAGTISDGSGVSTCESDAYYIKKLVEE
jgi:hypothetical protein